MGHDGKRERLEGGGGGGNKKKRHHGGGKPGKQGSGVPYGSRGFLITCNANWEQQAAREMSSILTEYVEKAAAKGAPPAAAPQGGQASFSPGEPFARSGGCLSSAPPGRFCRAAARALPTLACLLRSPSHLVAASALC